MKAGQYIVIGVLHVYRWVVSPLKNCLLGVTGTCRFYPTCSTYAMEAVRSRGVVCGGALALKRLCRCHPWGGAGLDPVPGPVRIHS